MVVRNTLFSAMCVAGLLGVAVAPASAGAGLTIPIKDIVTGPGIVMFTGTAFVTGPTKFNSNMYVVNAGNFPAAIFLKALPIGTGPASVGSTVLASFDFSGFPIGVYAATIGFDSKSGPITLTPGASESITVTIVPEPGTVAFGVIAAGSVAALVLRKRRTA